MKKKTSVLLFMIIFVVTAAFIGGFFSLLLPDIAGGQIREEAQNARTTETSAAGITAENENITKAAKQILPSVVGIITKSVATTEQQEQIAVNSSGSGIVIDERGYIVTNRHVIADAEEINVIFYDSTEAAATVVGSDRRTDLALLKVKKDNLKAAVFADTLPQVGETAIAVGSPGGTDFAGTVTKGIVSGLDRHLTTDDGVTFALIQTDAAINPGNSGGALCNQRGEVIGINTVKISESGFEGMGFAIPAPTVKTTVTDLLDYGTVPRGALGVYLLLAVNPEIAAEYNLGIDRGIMIQLQDSGAAAKAGLRDYDIIVAFNGEAVTDIYTLQQKVFSRHIGDVVTLDIYRGTEHLQIPVTLEQLEEE